MAYKESGWLVVWLLFIVAAATIYISTFLWPVMQECMQVHGQVVTNIWGFPVCVGGE